MNENLRNIRIENGETVENIAELLNIPVSEYIDKEKGIISTTNGEKKILAEYYGVDIDKLM
ncbi:MULTISPECIES: helix-turn-helix domain-containing protein [Clostridium]|uniref:Helix-turn-helix domain protein n=1 Tax=Clostridium colicanis DSM 13634 TaxID=1121305 RepID=A0A151AL85_9CLOT|nr:MULTISPECIES: helix-turn-helix transcriptional regulator [Clostridium]KYH28393.1 helix-turn-helix domain protein [Clostridium colicanis DSM 13634]MBE6043483.1 helix-turn-helix transcriptional regulator [Clostridium thermopalmarium]